MMGDDRDQGLALLRSMVSVSRETEERLNRFAATLREWQKIKNLVAPSTLSYLWTRHIADSAQAFAALPSARCWVDLGSGAGFPGLVTAILLRESEGGSVTLVESNSRKCAFLRAAARVCDVSVSIHNQRIEDFVKSVQTSYDAVSARALAPLDELLELASPLVLAGATGVFHKGQDVGSELTRASTYWNIEAELIPSRMLGGGSMLIMRNCTRRAI